MTTIINSFDTVDIISLIGAAITIIALFIANFTRKKETAGIAVLIAFLASITVAPLIFRNIVFLDTYHQAESETGIFVAESIFMVAIFYMPTLVSGFTALEKPDKPLSYQDFRRRMQRVADEEYESMMVDLYAHHPELLKRYRRSEHSNNHPQLPNLSNNKR